MANYLKSMIEVHGNEEVVNKVDELLEGVEYSDVTSFAKAFYNEVEMGESGEGVLNTWSMDNLGPKWTYLYDIQGDGAFSVESAWYPPIKFFIHLYNILVEVESALHQDVTRGGNAVDTMIGNLQIEYNGDGEVVQQWIKTTQDRQKMAELMDQSVAAMKDELPIYPPSTPVTGTLEDLANLHVVTDYHFGMLAWGEETGADWDLDLAEKLLVDWMSASIKTSPNAHTGILANIHRCRGDRSAPTAGCRHPAGNGQKMPG